ncbi:hypothetical protein TRFO_08101 [Tritrichomonas foetus]|uniref:Uncharacterized protein n=1 Tax=Tritrichomonas foetus TaxID=1144522 RepID=A0A1J4JM17_9EUKA|nr:hypothetical protein TRFO_08101 [Tritrichomonas foetus]|eukprot:OHT00115.1 hypothetical protein TRFO_08101 [Tritrichomonas foetus]
MKFLPQKLNRFHMNKEIIDLTQGDESDEDDGIKKITYSELPDNFSSTRKSCFIRSESTDLPMPMMFTPHPGSFDDPLGSPLINTAHSIAYAFSSSNIDPFSNLIRLLHQNSNDSNELFFQLTQSLAFNAKPVDFLPILLKLLDNNSKNPQPNFLRHLAIKSIIALSVNNPEFCKAVLDEVDFLITLSSEQDNEFLEDILQIYQTVCDYANLEQAKKIVDNINERDLIKYVPTSEDKNKRSPYGLDPIRIKVHSVLAILSKYGEVFTQPLVQEIRKKCNYPGNSNKKDSLVSEIILPSIICIDQFLKQPDTEAYKWLFEEKEILIGKLTLAVIGCEKNQDNELRVMVLKVFLEVLDEFCNDDNASPSMNFMFQLTSTLISMENFADEPVKHMARVLLKRFKVQ